MGSAAICIHSLVFSPQAGFSRNQNPVRLPVWPWHAASWANSQGQVAIAFPRLQTFPPSPLGAFTSNDVRPLAAEGGTLRGREMFRKISSRIRLPRNSRDLLHAANLRHGTDGFTSPPKESVLRIFSPLKVRGLRPGLNPRTWVPKASTLPLDHRSDMYTE